MNRRTHADATNSPPHHLTARAGSVRQRDGLRVLRRPVCVVGLALATSAVLAGTVGCSSSDAPPAPPVTKAISPPAPTSSLATSTSGVAPELQRQLTDAVTRYEHVYSSLYLNPRQVLGVVDSVATGQEAAGLRDQAKQVADQGLIVTGAIKVLRVTVVKVTPDPPVDATPVTATVKSCNDVSSVTGRTPDGKSVVDPKRLPQTQETLTLVNPAPANAAGWRVSNVQSGTTIPCGQ